ncbi:histidine phosphatase family protein [uncultured Roseobacter sp.]|uniref:SixA phosphatase family protein n=1 Tax=uncultured Roseobacter sp. TaxID=114847 RepID=UPI0026245FB0|nr:histidine phosphatase family protein [uncultured Roseobacter sp.]
MRRLILMRHAKSDWHCGGLSDHDRPLNKRGRRSADAMGAWLRNEGYLPDQVLCSSAQRTRETLERLQLTGEPDITFHRALYLAHASAMLDSLRAADGRCVLMLGHNHGLADLAHALVSQPPDHDRFDDYPTAATLVCDFEGDQWKETGQHSGRPVSFVVPRELI